VPLAPVVAVCVVLPLGVLSVNVTLAPETGVPPFATDAVIETVPGAVKVTPEMETETAKDGGVITVAFAVPDPVNDEVAAVMFTA
jgi:hypothetical protein